MGNPETWPSVAVTSKPAKERGGGKYTQFTAMGSTRMPCRHRITTSGRGKNEAVLRAQVAAQTEMAGKGHLKSCLKCKAAQA